MTHAARSSAESSGGPSPRSTKPAPVNTRPKRWQVGRQGGVDHLFSAAWLETSARQHAVDAFLRSQSRWVVCPLAGIGRQDVVAEQWKANSSDAEVGGGFGEARQQANKKFNKKLWPQPPRRFEHIAV